MKKRVILLISRVSSVLNKDFKNYGKQNLTDGSVETCWNSDQGSPQFIQIDFEQVLKKISTIEIMFQGGFACRELQIVVNKSEKKLVLYPHDDNQLQTFDVNINEPLNTMKLIFNEPTDFYGRIIVYHLDIKE